MELPGIASVVPCLAQRGAIVSPESPNDVVLAVGYQQKLLVLVGRKRELPDGTYPPCFGAQSELLKEFPLIGEHLHPIIDAIADVHKPISRDVNTMYRIAKLLTEWRAGIVRPRVVIIWRV